MEPHPAGKAGGSGLLGVVAGFLLVFILVAILSFIRVVVPQHVNFRSFHPYSVEQQQVRVAPVNPDRYLHHEASWVFQVPGAPGLQLHRPTCGR